MTGLLTENTVMTKRISPMAATDGQTYPLRYGAGLFLCCVGAGIVLAVLTDLDRGNLYFGIGVALGTVGYIVTGPRVIARYGRPRAYQFLLLAAVIALEVVAFILLGMVPRLRSLSPGATQIVVLAIVAFHFMLMRWSFGPWIWRLGVVQLVWVAVAAAAAVSQQVAILVFALINILFGALMAAPILMKAPAPSSDALPRD